MPGKSGLEAAEEVKKRFPDTCVILNTAFAEFELQEKPLSIRLDAYLLKPASEEIIIDTIKNCLKKKKKEYREEKIGNQKFGLRDCLY